MPKSNEWIGNCNMEFFDAKQGLGMELEYEKFRVELYSQSGIQDGFPTLLVIAVVNMRNFFNYVRSKCLALLRSIIIVLYGGKQ